MKYIVLKERNAQKYEINIEKFKMAQLNYSEEMRNSLLLIDKEVSANIRS